MKYLALAFSFLFLAGNQLFAFNSEATEMPSEAEITLDTCDIPKLIARDTTVCAGTVIKLAEEIFFTNSTYHWSPGTGLNDSTLSGPIVTAEDTIRYILTTTSGDSSCVHQDTIDINVIPIEAFIDNPDTILLCLEDSVRLDAFFEPQDATWAWNTAVGLSDPMSENPWAKPVITTTYIFTVTTDQCMRSDSVFIRVDSLPLYLDTLTVTPVKDPYCAGEVISIFSPMYHIANFPNIEHQWFPDDGTIQTDSTLLNIGIELQDTTEYIRVTMNGGCLDSAMITINVIPPEIPLSVNDTTLCPGAQFQVRVLDLAVEDLEWEPTEGLNCDACFNPIVTVIGQPGTTQSHTVMGTKEGCPVGAQLTINIPPLEAVPDTVIFFCPGDGPSSVDYSGLGFTDFQWGVLSGQASLSCDDCPNPTITPGGDALIQFIANNNEDPNFCGAVGNVFIQQGAIETIEIGDFALCPGESSIIELNDPLLNNFSWITQDGDAQLSCNDCPNPTITGGSTVTTISFTATNDKEGFCTATGSFIVSIDDIQDISAPPLQLCANVPDTLDLSFLGLTNLSIDLQGGNTSCSNCVNPIISVTDNAVLTVTGDLPGTTCLGRAVIQISTFPTNDAPSLQCVPGDTVDIGTNIEIRLGGFHSATTGVWTYNDEVLGETGLVLQVPAVNLVNTVTFEYTDQFGCPIIVSSVCFARDVEPKYPEAFTPNNDELNDFFRPISYGTFTLERLRVFNRWGQLVYDDNDPEGWNGKWDNDQNASADVYVYVAELRRDGDSRIVTIKGDVALIR